MTQHNEHNIMIMNNHQSNDHHTRTCGARAIGVVMELLLNGNLADFLSRSSAEAEVVGWDQRCSFARDIACGMSVLHAIRPHPVVYVLRVVPRCFTATLCCRLNSCAACIEHSHHTHRKACNGGSLLPSFAPPPARVCLITFRLFDKLCGAGTVI